MSALPPTCTRRLQWCSGHRVMRHESKCAHLHGHNYVGYFTATGSLDEVGRVIDFSVLKERIGGWIDVHWDHGLILHKDDDQMISALRHFRPLIRPDGVPIATEQKLYLMENNPTAENMAAHLLREICPWAMEETGVTVTKVRIWETENCYADAQG